MAKDKKSSYYDAGGIETLDIIKAKLTPEQYRGYLLGNIIKYSCRVNYKGTPERDAEKMINYSLWHSQELNRQLGELNRQTAEEEYKHGGQDE